MAGHASTSRVIENGARTFQARPRVPCPCWRSTGHTYIGSDALVERWRGFNGCTPSVETGDPVDFDFNVGGPETHLMDWSECTDCTRVDHWKMVGSGHVPGFNATFKDALVDWLVTRACPPARCP